MADALGGAGKVEEDRRAKLAEAERQEALRDLAATTLAAASAAVRKLQAKDGGSLLGEPARDLLAIRTDPKFSKAFRADLGRALGRIESALQTALWDGFTTAAETRTKGLPVWVDLDPSDRAALAGLPIGGLTAGETAQEIVDTLERAVLRSLAAPLADTDSPADVGTLLSQALEAHAQRSSQAIEQAHMVGVSAFMRALAAVLTGGG